MSGFEFTKQFVLALFCLATVSGRFSSARRVLGYDNYRLWSVTGNRSKSVCFNGGKANNHVFTSMNGFAVVTPNGQVGVSTHFNEVSHQSCIAFTANGSMTMVYGMMATFLSIPSSVTGIFLRTREIKVKTGTVTIYHDWCPTTPSVWLAITSVRLGMDYYQKVAMRTKTRKNFSVVHVTSKQETSIQVAVHCSLEITRRELQFGEVRYPNLAASFLTGTRYVWTWVTFSPEMSCDKPQVIIGLIGFEFFSGVNSSYDVYSLFDQKSISKTGFTMQVASVTTNIRFVGVSWIASCVSDPAEQVPPGVVNIVNKPLNRNLLIGIGCAIGACCLCGLCGCAFFVVYTSDRHDKSVTCCCIGNDRESEDGQDEQSEEVPSNAESETVGLRVADAKN